MNYISKYSPIISKSGKVGGLSIAGVVDTRGTDIASYNARFPKINIPSSLPIGAIGYFPISVNHEGDPVYQQVNYLPRKYHDMLLAASAWELIDPRAMKTLGKMTYVGVGLSVGSALLNVAIRYNIQKVVACDPDDTDTINTARLVETRQLFRGVSKDYITRYTALEYNPYLDITTYAESVSDNNADLIFSKKPGSDTIIVAEIDDAYAQELCHSRTGAHRISLADVGHGAITIAYDAPGEPANQGRTKSINPAVPQNRMPYLMAMLGNLASPAFFQLVPRIGPGKDITSVPQTFSAVTLAMTAFGSILEQIGLGQKPPRLIHIDINQILKNN